jgi:BR serine/threonine kinase
MHTNGKVHRDLKLDNLLLDKDWNLIVADLGFTAPVEGRTPEGFLQTKRGTPIYLAPEVHAGVPYRGQHVDLFAASICLFNMMTQVPPFMMAVPEDELYSDFPQNRANVFWQKHEANRPAGFFSE